VYERNAQKKTGGRRPAADVKIISKKWI